MDRRSVLKGGLAAAAFGVTGAAALSEEETADAKNTRSVFKVIRHQSVTHLRVGSDQWEPSPEDIDDIISAFIEAGEHKASVVGTNKDVEISTLSPGGVILVKIDFKDLKKGDQFVMYEDTGEVVEPEAPVWVCTGDAYVRGHWIVEAEPVEDQSYAIPETCPA